ncbi:hypothetical protein [Flavobacterium algicola]|uniref:hypothetical protein n=1 Tax=Flavobacterium algicola TaxID=556529 RepID=UPI001EFC518A|nr:hypothetical protein [Flavobacterium algicola]MCG9791276.1 hypothetical protein [Flavobacterium algicola]
MKKVFIVALLAMSLTGFAQKKVGAEKMLDKMTTELLLTPDQQKQVRPFFEEQAALKADTKANPSHEEANKAKSKEIGKKINAVLTDDQKQLNKVIKEKEKAAKEAAAQ